MICLGIVAFANNVTVVYHMLLCSALYATVLSVLSCPMRAVGCSALLITGLDFVSSVPLPAYSLTLNEAVDLAQNRHLWRLVSTYGATHSNGACQKRSTSTQEIGWEDHLRNDLFCAEWNVKP